MINFPKNPVQGQKYSAGIKTWMFNGRAWELQSISDAQVQRAETAAVNATASADAAKSNLDAFRAEYATVASWGVKGDGVKSDTVALDNAFSAICASGGTLYIGAGTYKLDQASRVHSYQFNCVKDVRIVLAPGAKLVFSGGFKGFQFIGASNTRTETVQIEGGTVDGAANGNYFDQPSPGIFAFAGSGLARFIILGVTATNINGTSPFHHQYINHAVVKYCRIINCSGNNTNPDGASVDEYGDGIYSARVDCGEYAYNYIYNDLSQAAIQPGRAGIVIEFDNKNCHVHHNTIFGYDRGVHLELVGGSNRVEWNNIAGCRTGVILWNCNGYAQEILDNQITNVGAPAAGKTWQLYTSAGILLIGFDTNAGTIIERNEIVMAAGSLLPASILCITSSDVLVSKNRITDATKSVPLLVIGLDGTHKLRGVKIVKNDILCGDLTATDNYALNIEDNTIRCGVFTYACYKLGNPDGSATFYRDGDPALVPERGRIARNIITHHTNTYFVGVLVGTFDFIENDVSVIPSDALRLFRNPLARYSTYGEVSGNVFRVNDAARNDPAYLFNYAAMCGFKTVKQNAYINNALPATTYFGCEGNNATSRGAVEVCITAAPAAGTWRVGDRAVHQAPAVGAPKAWACTVAGTPGTWVSEGNL